MIIFYIHKGAIIFVWNVYLRKEKEREKETGGENLARERPS